MTNDEARMSKEARMMKLERAIGPFGIRISCFVFLSFPARRDAWTFVIGVRVPRVMFERILVANRGEIALRVIRACKEMGVEVVAVYSEADRGAPYLQLADAAYCIGPAASKDSYLDIKRIIAAAEIADVQAIHPGYGFLSENPHFAEVCRSCNIEFIGPPQEAMRRLGNKNEARKLAQQAGVPVVPGSEGLIETDADALRLAHAMGYPVLIKAAAGGGG